MERSFAEDLRKLQEGEATLEEIKKELREGRKIHDEL